MRRGRLIGAVTLTLILIISSSIARQSDDVVRIETDLVLINATVTDNAGRYVPNLRVEDFILKEDGARRQITHFTAEDAPFAAAILIDTSGSMLTKLPRARVAASRFIDNLRTDDVVTVYGFNTVIERLQDFSTERDISPDVWEMEAKGLTRLYDCLYEAIGALSTRPEQRRAIVLISDGADTDSRHTEKEVLALALRIGATIYAIDITEVGAIRDRRMLQAGATLKNFAEKTGGQYIESIGGQQLVERLLGISRELRAQYTLGFYPDKRTGGRQHRLALEIPSRHDLKVRARQEYGGK